MALLIEDVSLAEGLEALELNETLKADPNTAVPDTLRQRVMKVIQAECRKKSSKEVGHKFKKILRNIALVATIPLLLFSAAFAISEQFRVSTYNTILRVYDTCSVFSFNAPTTDSEDNIIEDPNTSLEYFYNIAFQYLPDGYENIWGFTSPFDGVTFARSDGFELNINVIPFTCTAVYHFDTENTTQQEIMVNGTTATLYTKYIDYTPGISPYTWHFVQWLDYNREIAIMAHADDMPADELIRIMEGVVWAGPHSEN